MSKKKQISQRQTMRTLLVGLLFFLAIFTFIAPSSEAILYVEMKTVSGKLTELNADGSVTLSDGEVYSPANPKIVMNLGRGAQITLLYYTAVDGKRIYTRYAPGKNSFKAPTPKLPQGKRSLK